MTVGDARGLGPIEASAGDEAGGGAAGIWACGEQAATAKANATAMRRPPWRPLIPA